MRHNILSQVGVPNSDIKKSANDSFSFANLCRILIDLMDANVCIQNKQGCVIGGNYKIKHDSKTRKKCFLDVPIMDGEEKIGTLLMTRYPTTFRNDNLVLGEFSTTVEGLEIQRSINQQNQEEARKVEIVKVAMSTLSYSENEAIKRIIDELNGMEGIIVTSKIAEHYKITRSIIISAIRKLESAGIIVSKSLGMKGTYIQVLNKSLWDNWTIKR